MDEEVHRDRTEFSGNSTSNFLGTTKSTRSKKEDNEQYGGKFKKLTAAAMNIRQDLKISFSVGLEMM